MSPVKTKSFNDHEAIHQVVLDAAPDGVIVVNTEGKIIMCNNQVFRLFGYEKTELLGKHIELLIPNRYTANHQTARSKYSNHPTIKGMGEKRELSAKRKDETEFYADISLSPATISKETVIISTIRDVTEKIELNHKLKESLKSLENKNAELERFTYIVSHDLKSPLNSIIGLVQLLKTTSIAKADEENTSILNMIEESTQRLITLIIDLLDYALVGTKREKEQIDCNNLLTEIKIDLNQQISGNHASLTIGELPSLMGYRTELRQLFQNIIVNAIKFKKPDSSPVIAITSKSEGDSWHFCIQDNGIGIEKAHFEKIFGTFQRLHRKDEYEGTGIGLATCSKIVKLHQGEIWVESELGAGSIFHFTLSKSL